MLLFLGMAFEVVGIGGVVRVCCVLPPESEVCVFDDRGGGVGRLVNWSRAYCPAHYFSTCLSEGAGEPCRAVLAAVEPFPVRCVDARCNGRDLWTYVGPGGEVIGRVSRAEEDLAIIGPAQDQELVVHRTA